MRKFNIPNQQFVGINKNKIRSKHAIFGETENEIQYDQIIERNDWPGEAFINFNPIG